MAASYRETPVLESLFNFEFWVLRDLWKHLFWRTSRVRAAFENDKSSWNWEKLKFLRSFNFTLKNMFFQHQYQRQVKMFAFTSWLVSHENWCGENEASNTKYLELIKRRLKVQENNMSCKRTLDFDKWKTFSKNSKPMRVWLWLVYKFTENCQIYRLLSEFIQT